MAYWILKDLLKAIERLVKQLIRPGPWHCPSSPWPLPLPLSNQSIAPAFVQSVPGQCPCPCPFSPWPLPLSNQSLAPTTARSLAPAPAFVPSVPGLWVQSVHSPWHCPISPCPCHCPISPWPLRLSNQSCPCHCPISPWPMPLPLSNQSIATAIVQSVPGPYNCPVPSPCPCHCPISPWPLGSISP